MRGTGIRWWTYEDDGEKGEAAPGEREQRDAIQNLAFEKEETMIRTPKLEKNDEGGYTGSLSDQMRLDAIEKKAVRRCLADSEVPLHLTQIAAKCNIALTTPSKQTAFANFLEVYLTSTHEVEMAFEKGRRNEERFVGWRSTRHGKELISKGLA